MKESFVKGNCLVRAGSSEGKGLENYSSAQIEGFSPSMKLILNILEGQEYFQDARQCLYRIKC